MDEVREETEARSYRALVKAPERAVVEILGSTD